MKKLLVTLLLAAGLVTVASAMQFDCTVHPQNQCCKDVSNMMTAINQSPTHTILTTDKYSITGWATVLEDNGVEQNTCEDQGEYLINGASTGQAEFVWEPANWINSISI